jgi:pyridoxamine 5'-phosphate oxidase
MTLATASLKGMPSSRIVLLKGWSEKGGLFFTNYESRKSVELVQNPHASCTFWWKELEQQVIIEGTVEKVSRSLSKHYFHSRPKSSQLAALISLQGEELVSRQALEEAIKEGKKKYADKEIPLPKHWGGFLLKPTHFHFWQGRRNRLHDRFSYTKEGRTWKIKRIYP